MSNDASHCAKCGAPLPVNWPKGLCSRCALEGALELSNAESQVLQPDSPQGPDRTVAVSESDLVLDRTGAMIGRYKLLQKIGEGGFGVVYMAEQQEPVQRKVALKIIKAGMDTREVIARFEAERQAIALMDHPNIARVLDAGATEAGRPYFVMELVRGIPITDFCDQGNLPAAERLKLFMTVCHAVQHAHQKGVIHRDIKPSNVLVTLHDGAPVPKVIDFGVAKALGQKLTEKTLFTAFHHMIGTPAYMSPEQAALSGLDIDTRADIYSLGVLLYELLTGVTPFDAETFRKVALDEVRRMIRETEPLKPSTRLQTLGAKLIEVAKQRQTEPAALGRLVRGDLDWIVMKCLEKDRTRRYVTANGLAMDLERYLNSEPVAARPPSAAYRFQKLVRRNKLAVAAAAAVTAALVLGVVVSTWQAIRATRAEREQSRLRETAQIEARNNKQVAQVLKNMLAGAGASRAKGRDSAMLLELLDDTADRIGKDLTNQPSVAAELRQTLGAVYNSFGEHARRVAMEREGLRLRKSFFGETNEFVALSLHGLAQALQKAGELDEAETACRQALAMQRNTLGEHRIEVSRTLSDLGLILRDQGKLDEAESALRQALAIRRELSGAEHRGVALSLHGLALVVRDQGKFEEAEILHGKALAMRRKLFGHEHLDIASSLHGLSNVLRRQGKMTEAEGAANEALAIRRKLLPNEHPEVAWCLLEMARLLRDQGKLAAADTMLSEALAIQKKIWGGEDPGMIFWFNERGYVLLLEGKLAESETLHREALTLCEKVLGEKMLGGSSILADTLAGLGLTLQEQGRLAEAEVNLSKALALRRKLGSEHIDVATSLAHLASVLLMEQKFADAESPAREMLAFYKNISSDRWCKFDGESKLGGSLLGQKKYADAEPLLLSGYEGMKQRENKIALQDKKHLKAALQRIVQLYEETGRPAQAAEWKKKLAEFDTAEK